MQQPRPGRQEGKEFRIKDPAGFFRQRQQANENIRLRKKAGKLVRAEQSVAMDSVPEPVKQALQKKHPDGEVALAEKVTSAGAVIYEFRVKQKNKSVEVAFDPTGKEVKVKR